MGDSYRSIQGDFSKAILSMSLLPILLSCAEFVEIDPPRTELVTATVYATDATANAAIIDIYAGLSTSGFISGTVTSISLFCSYSADEQQNYSSVSELQEFVDNDLLPKNTFALGLWSDMYKTIYKANAVIEGCAQSPGISLELKKQLEGEAKFFRAFSHFYLVNLFGDVPLITTTNYQANSTIGRTAAYEVYQQIIIDLKDAQVLLPEDYSFANNERVRVNKYAATAMLARTYLHLEDWPNAEIEATRIIGNNSYSLVADLNLVFRKNSTEAIWQFYTENLVNDFNTFRILPSSAPNTGAFRLGFVDYFESGDKRRNDWVRNTNYLGANYFYPAKYKSANNGEDYSTLIRLAEIYLIRAEALAQQGHISDAQRDLNKVRARAGLIDTPANDKASLLLAIERERIVELFTEQGLRWLDLKRTGRADAVLTTVKGSTWKQTDVLYPIPEQQILADPAMKGAQNPGY